MSVLVRSCRSYIFGCSQNSACLKASHGAVRSVLTMSNVEESPVPSPDKSGKGRKLLKSTTRYNGRVKKRKWGELPEDIAYRKMREEGVPFVRIKKKKMAMLLGYSGVDYYGMQRNPEMKTVEQDLFQALLDCEYINMEGFSQPQTVSFQRAARTDKGVSAARQIVSIKLPEATDVSRINEKLPPAIRVFAVKRATKGFNSKMHCDARTYSYTLPTYTFETHHTPIEDYVAYRTTSEKVSHLNDILANYKGSKNYHNFTTKVKSTNPSAKRYMLSFTCDKLFEAEGMEFAVLKVKGQSFMMHQIRKMVGMALAILRGLSTVDTLHKAFTSERIDMPTAPGLGLVLDYVHYDRYNSRYGDDGMHESITWDNVESEIEKFKSEHIYPTIVKTEALEKPMAYWVENLHRHSYEPRDEDEALNAEGGDNGSDGEDGEEVEEEEKAQAS